MTKRSLEVITTHLNADFDALASMVAAKKLYPNALLVFPGAQERNLREFFVRSSLYFLDFAKVKDINLEEIKRLILVDVRQASRIGKFAEALPNKDIELHIYDHHPSSPDDLSGDLEVIRPAGAAVSILTKIIRERQLPITPDEATIMALGIYEDTGSFTFASTTVEDFEAASYLLSQGANLNTVSEMLTRELTAEQVALLNDMIRNASTLNINGVDIVLARATASQYIGDFAVLAHKYMDMENINVLFALAQMEDRVYIVGRSRLQEVNVGEILSEMGGGGHSYAASATIKDTPLAQVEETLRQILQTQISPRRTARELMSFPVKAISPEATMADAHQSLTRLNMNALLVMDQEKLVGLISRQIVEKAIYHGLQDLPVKEYMTTEFATVGPEASLAEIQQRLVISKQRLLPVVAQNRVLGVITRTDLLNLLMASGAGAEFKLDKDLVQPLRKKKISGLLRERLPQRILKILHQVGRVADELGYNAYVVGGFVRDLLLRHENLDIDIVIEGDGIAFARKFAERHEVRVRVFHKLKTAVIIFPDGFKIDVATARTEYYEAPGALPIVEGSSIKMDLYRRDFTINTLAVKLNERHFGILIDFFGAQRDLKEQRISVLHNLSFVEDPTRVFRAIRFEQRFNFQISKLTASLIENAVKINFFERLSGSRLFGELKLILQEENPIPAIARMASFNLLQFIHPSLRCDQATKWMLDQVRAVLSWYDLLFLDDPYERWLVYFLGLIEPLKGEQLRELTHRLNMKPKMAETMLWAKEAADEALVRLYRQPDLGRREIYHLLHMLPTEFLIYMMAKTRQEASKRAISLYFTQLKNVQPLLKGRDLRAMGYTPGPQFKIMLQSLLDARLNQEVSTIEEEREYIRTHFGRPAVELAAAP
ncbi:MAG: CBS domain-containing protein [Deltaproteobacteria bacterium]|nr:CBS domain-containing protein [Deltaproteobacteria bacterium]MBW1986601.1 CBS domain-containing protein [Deltaproteobacteria bacterium]MBW2134799.1 CBS domain-containing protein [Deltaproteobacteria bacterium]